MTYVQPALPQAKTSFVPSEVEGRGSEVGGAPLEFARDERVRGKAQELSGSGRL
jgi:hypothetical protein